MSSQPNRIWPFVVAFSVIGAGMGGAAMRKQREMGEIPTPAVADIDSRTLVASTEMQSGLSESEYFYRLLDLIKREFVDPVDDDQKLAVGAVRGMVNSLSDPHAIFMSEEQFPAFQSAQNGKVEGIGVEVDLKFDLVQLKKFYASQAKLAEWNASGRKEVDGKLEDLPDIQPGALIPDIVVSAVIPGSPAEKAGIKPGDLIDGIDGKWSLNRREVTELNDAFEKIRQNKMDRQAYLDLRKKYITRSENAIAPGRIREKLTVGKTGQVKLYWKSPGTPAVKTASVSKDVTKVPAISDTKLKFVLGVDQALQDAVAKKLVAFDLRNSGFGNFSAAEKALANLLPAGDYGFTTSERNDKIIPFNVKGTASETPILKLTVDGTTRGAARFFAAVMKAAGRATLEGDLGPEPVFIFQTVAIQGGAGYIIPTAIYRAEEATS